MADVRCDQCGTVNPAAAQFCASCDAFLDGASPVTESADDEPSTPPGPTTGGRARTTDSRTGPETPSSGPAPTSPRRPLADAPDTGPRPPTEAPPDVAASTPTDAAARADAGGSGGEPSTTAEVGPVRATPKPPPIQPVKPIRADPSARQRSAAHAQTLETAPTVDRRDLAGPRCPVCGRLNPSGRQLCACGTPLHGDLATPQAEQPHDPWRRRAVRAPLARRSFRRALRTAAGGRQPFDQPLAARVRWFRAISGGLLGVLLLAGFGPWRGGMMNFLADQWARLVPGQTRTVPVAAVTVEPDQPQEDGFLPSYAVDGIPTRAWAVAWDPDAVEEPGPPCAGSRAAGGALRVLFERPSEVNRVTVRAGLDRSLEDWSKQARPRQIDVGFSDGTCIRATLDDRAEPQQLENLEVGQVDSATLTLVDAYPALAGEGRLIAVSEIAFEVG